MYRISRPFAASFAAVSLIAAGFITASAQAEPATTITGHVETTSNAPLRGVIVFAVNGNSRVQFHATDESGDFGTPVIGHLTAGTWTFVFWDTTDKYASVAQENVLLGGGGATVVPDQQLQLGGRVTGKVTAPSGAELKNVPVEGVDPAAFDESDALWNLGVGLASDETDTDGTFDIRSLDVVASQDLFLAFDEESNFRPVGTFSINTEGELVTGMDITNVKVPVSASERGYTSSSRGRASIRATVSASKYGIANPGGKFDIYDGSKKIKSAVGLVNGTRLVSLSGLKKGTHSFRFKYLGAIDTNAKWSSTVHVRVR